MIESPLVLVEKMHSLRVKDVMKPVLFSVGKENTLHEVQKILKEQHLSGIPVTEGRRLQGIVSIADILSAYDEGHIDDKVALHMSKKVVVLEEDMPLTFAMDTIDKYSFNRFPVLNSKREMSGIITSRDIIMYLLQAMNLEIAILEKKVSELNAKENEAENLTFGTSKSQVLRYATVRHDFKNSGKGSIELKDTLKKMGVPRPLIRRVSVAAYELEMNQVVHSLGGEMLFIIRDFKVEIISKDKGPGIPDTTKALEEGFSTATEWIRSMGFGAGMGLPNIKRVSDHFMITSSPSGTEVRVVIYIDGKDHSKDEE